MRQLCNRLLVVCVIGLAATQHSSSIAASQQSATSQTAALPTAAELALMLNKMDAPAAETVRAAIGASDPMVRTVAARIAAVTSHPPFVNALTTAFAKEEDPKAATEQVRALLVIGGLQATEIVEARLGALPVIAQTYSDWLASSFPERFADTLAKIATAQGDSRKGLAGDVGTALDKQPAIAERLLRTWLGISTAKEWAASLSAIHRSTRPGQEPVLIEALTTAKPEIREETMWDLVERLATKRPVSTSLLDAVAPATATDAASDTTAVTWEQFGRELIARRHRARRTPDRSAFLTAEAPTHASRAIAVARMPQTLETERKLLKTILGDRFPEEETRKIPEVTRERSGPSMRTMPVPWPGFVKQLLDASKCVPSKSPMFGAAYVRYGPSGIVTQIRLTELTMPPGCDSALTALARLTMMDPDVRPPEGEGEVLVLPLGRESVDCSHEASLYVGPPPNALNRSESVGSGKIVAPRKARDVKPVYPQTARQSRIQGTVLLESNISHTGCVTNLKVLVGVSPAIDLSAVRAVSQWQFTPTLLDGKPVPVMMTVAVNFKLQ